MITFSIILVRKEGKVPSVVSPYRCNVSFWHTVGLLNEKKELSTEEMGRKFSCCVISAFVGYLRATGYVYTPSSPGPMAAGSMWGFSSILLSHR